MKDFLLKYTHWIVLGAAILWTVLETLPASSRSGEIDLAEFGRLPALADGRLKPLDSVARQNLLIISNQQEFRDKDGNKQPAIRWLADVMASGSPRGIGAKHRVFRIDYDQVLDLLKLERREGYRYAYSEILPYKHKLDEARARAEASPADKRDLYQTKVLELGEHLDRYEQLAEHKAPRMLPPQADGEEWQPLLFADMMVLTREIKPLVPELRQKAAAAVERQARKGGNGDGGAGAAGNANDQSDPVFQDEFFRLLQEKLREKRAELYPAAEALDNVLTAYRDGNGRRFDEAMAEFRGKYFGRVAEGAIDRVNFEAFMNRFTPFLVCAFLFVSAAVLAAVGWLYWPQTLHRAAFWLALLTLAVQTFALFGRMYLMDRPLVFVTNLYSSAVFIGWGCAGLGLILEVIYRNGIGVAVGSVLGATSNAIAHNLLAGSGSADTLEMMQAVLDTNLWLATHVTTVTLGYVSTLVAGGIGIFYIVSGVFTTFLDRTNAKSVSSMLYGVICFATLLSFVGTVLGGIWADQSWGRFWGWDPKENGAVLVVIWNSLILHARWGGLIKQRGMAVLSLVGIMVTFWSWFGTNQLGVGLHAYGFSNKLAVMCLVVWGLMIGLICLGLTPLRHWASFRPNPAPGVSGPAPAVDARPYPNGHVHGPGRVGPKPGTGSRR